MLACGWVKRGAWSLKSLTQTDIWPRAVLAGYPDSGRGYVGCDAYFIRRYLLLDRTSGLSGIVLACRANVIDKSRARTLRFIIGSDSIRIREVAGSCPWQAKSGMDCQLIRSLT